MNEDLTRPGIRTTEFWLSLIAVVAINLAAAYSSAEWSVPVAILGNALVAAGYGFSRAGVKRTETAATAAANERADVIKLQSGAKR